MKSVHSHLQQIKNSWVFYLHPRRGEHFVLQVGNSSRYRVGQIHRILCQQDFVGFWELEMLDEEHKLPGSSSSGKVQLPQKSVGISVSSIAVRGISPGIGLGYSGMFVF